MDERLVKDGTRHIGPSMLLDLLLKRGSSGVCGYGQWQSLTKTREGTRGGKGQKEGKAPISGPYFSEGKKQSLSDLLKGDEIWDAIYSKFDTKA